MDVKRIRRIRKWGNSHTILLTATDMKDLELKEGDEVDISDIVVKKQKKPRGNKK